MERRKGIPLVALVIFIALLVAIILTCVIILGTNKKSGNQNKQTSETSNSTNEEVEPTEPEEEIGETIDLEDVLNLDTDIQDAYKLAGNGKTFAKYAIYASGGFDTDEDNLKNELKLQLAMAQVTNSDMDQSSSTKAVSKEKVAEYAGKLFEETEDIEYKDFSLYDSDTNFTDVYKTVGYVYNADKESYEIQENDVTEDIPSEITEVVTKAVKYESKIEVYVKPLFIKTFYSEEIQGMGCEIFANYDFQNKEYLESFIAIAYSDYNEILKSEYNKDIDGYKYSEISSNIDLNRVQEYKYTFIKTEDGYKIKSFGKANLESSNAQDVIDAGAEEMSEEEKEMFNAIVKKYVGEGKKATDAQLLIDDVAIQNSNNMENLDRIITITLDDTKTELVDDDVEGLNDDILALSEKIDFEATYTIKATYKSGIIVEATITKE